MNLLDIFCCRLQPDFIWSGWLKLVRIGVILVLRWPWLAEWDIPIARKHPDRSGKNLNSLKGYSDWLIAKKFPSEKEEFLHYPGCDLLCFVAIFGWVDVLPAIPSSSSNFPRRFVIASSFIPEVSILPNVLTHKRDKGISRGPNSLTVIFAKRQQLGPSTRHRSIEWRGERDTCDTCEIRIISVVFSGEIYIDI